MFQDFRFLALHTASVSLLEGFKSQYFLKKYVVHVAMKTLDLTNVHTDAPKIQQTKIAVTKI